MRGSSWWLSVCNFVLMGCSAATPVRSPVAVPAAVDGLAAETCGQFELVVDKGKPTARAVTNLRARCDSSYTCAPRVSSNRVELQGLAPGKTTLHLEYTDPATGKSYANDIPVAVAAAKSSDGARYGTKGCAYIPTLSPN